MSGRVEFVIINALVKVEKCRDEHSYLNIVYCIHLQSWRFIWELNLTLQMLLIFSNLNSDNCYMSGKRNVTIFHTELGLDFLWMLSLVWTTFLNHTCTFIGKHFWEQNNNKFHFICWNCVFFPCKEKKDVGGRQQTSLGLSVLTTFNWIKEDEIGSWDDEDTHCSKSQGYR